MQVLTVQQQVEFQAQVQRRAELRLQLEVMRAEHGFGGGHGTGNCINN